jgi:hypothetical protein
VATYEDLYYALNQGTGDHRLWRQAYVATLKAATDIRAENPATANHANRLAWALAVEQDTIANVLAMRNRILENPTLAAAPSSASDSDVQFVVNSLIDSFATG